MAARQRELRISISGDSKSFERATKNVGRDLDQLQRRGTVAFRKLGGAAQAGGLAISAGLALGLKKSADAAIEAEKAQARLNAQLKAIGKNTPQARREIDAAVTSLSRLSGFDDEDLQDSFVNIVRVTGDVSKSLELNAIAADLARAKQIDVAKAGEIVGKVAGGNVGILARYGIQLERGATASEALAALQAKVSGQAEEFGRTTAGSTERAKVAFENLAESVGGAVTPAIAAVADTMSTFVTEIQTGEGAGGRFRDTVVGAFERVKGAAAALASAFGSVRASGAAMAGLGAVIGSIVAAFAATKILAFVAAVKTAGSVLMALRANPVLLIASAVGAAAGALGLFKLKTDEGALSQQRLADAMRSVHDALDQIADADLAAKQAKLNHQAAVNSLRLAEENLARVRNDPNASPAQRRQAEIGVAQAQVEVARTSREAARADRDMQDTVRAGTATVRENTQSLKQDVEARKGRVSSLRRGVTELEREIATMRRNGASADELRPKLEELKDKKRELRTQTGLLREAQDRLAGSQRDVRETARQAALRISALAGELRDLRKLSRTELQLYVELAFQGFPRLKPLEDLARGGRRGGGRGGRRDGGDGRGFGLFGDVKAGAEQIVRQNQDRLLPNLMGGGRGIVSIGRMLQGMGYHVSEHPAFGGVRARHTANSYHYRGRAIDVNADGAPGGEAAWLDRLAAMLRPLNPTELLWRTRGHYDHLHLAFQRGGLIPGVGSGDKVPVLAEPGEGFINRRAVTALGGPAAIDAINRIVPRFQGGGTLPARGIADVARRAGFRGTALKNAVAVALAESGGRVSARNYNPPVEDSQGLWQINTLAHRWARNLFDPLSNARAAFRVSGGGRNWGPWSVWPGRARQFFGEARRAAIDSGRQGSRGGAPRTGRGFLPDSPFGSDPDPDMIPDSMGAAKAGFVGGKAGFAPRGLLGDALGPTIGADDVGGGEDPAVAAINANTAATEALREEQAALRLEIKRTNDFANSVVATENFQLAKGLADILSGHIAGYGIAGRRLTAGAGQVARSY